MTTKRDLNALLRQAAGGISYRVHQPEPEPEPEAKGSDASAGTGRKPDQVPTPPDPNALLRAVIGYH